MQEEPNNNQPAVHVTVNNSGHHGLLERNWIVALILSALLGWIGIDSFYLGQTAKGLLKFFTFGLFGILWLIDFIMILTKSVRGIKWVN